MKTISTSKKLSILVTLFFVFALMYTDAQTSHNVSVTSNVFTPSSLTINVGDTVIWTNTQGSHNVNGTTDDYPNNPESFGNNVGSGWTYEFVFNTAGSYEYQCDPHVNFGMTGTITVNEVMQENTLTVNFTGMTPHAGQDLWLSVTNSQTGMELERVKKTVEESFSIEIMGIENGESYNIDFFADHNGNGMYDAPPADHAWRIELMDVDGDETVDFAHNTEFTDIMWMNMLTIEFSGMSPHVGQDLWLSVINTQTSNELKRVHQVVDENFNIYVMGIEVGESYNVDFYADHNGNGSYDAPPADHAWRIELTDVQGDTTLMFAHNTSFTDIMWMHKLTVNFTGMSPHVDQKFELAVIDQETSSELGNISLIVTEEFTVSVWGIVVGESYNIDFFADHNGNEAYDAPPTDHAWRIELIDVLGDTVINFEHNTSFTDIRNTTDFNEIDRQAEFHVYPNPTYNYLNISLGKLSKESSVIKIYNIAGVVLKEDYINPGKELIRYPVDGYTRGLYFISVESGDHRNVSRFVKY